MSMTDEAASGRAVAALEAAGDAAYSWDLNADGLEWGGQIRAAGIDLAAEADTGRRLAGRIHPDDLVQRQLMLVSLFEGDAEFDCEFRLRDGSGGFVWVHERGRVQRDAAGRPQLMLGVLRTT